MKTYREISTDAELVLVLASCDCDGYDIVRTFRKEERLSCEYAACVCGAHRARRKPQGGWSVVIDDVVRARLKPPAACKTFSITGQPDR